MADFFLSKYWDKEFPEKSTIFFCFTHYSDINSRLRLGSIVNPPPTSPLNSLSFWCKFWYKFQVEAMQCSYAPPFSSEQPFFAVGITAASLGSRKCGWEIGRTPVLAVRHAAQCFLRPGSMLLSTTPALPRHRNPGRGPSRIYYLPVGNVGLCFLARHEHSLVIWLLLLWDLTPFTFRTLTFELVWAALLTVSSPGASHIYQALESLSPSFTDWQY